VRLSGGQYTVAAVEFRRALNGDGRRVQPFAWVTWPSRTKIRAQPPVGIRPPAAWEPSADWPLSTVRAVRHLPEQTAPERIRRHSFARALHTEMFLREARVAAYMSDLPLAMLALRRAIEAGHGGCEGSTQLFCRQLLLNVLEEPGKDGALEALETYLALPGRTEGLLALTLIRAAAEKAAALGAPVFAGNVMASSAQVVDTSNRTSWASSCCEPWSSIWWAAIAHAHAW